MYDLTDDQHLDVCQNIEVGLKLEYERRPSLTDELCIFALENAKIAVKKSLGFAKNERVSDMEEIQGIIAWCMEVGQARIDKVNDLTSKEYLARIEKVRKSVKRHVGSDKRAYYKFIRQFM